MQMWGNVAAPGREECSSLFAAVCTRSPQELANGEIDQPIQFKSHVWRGCIPVVRVGTAAHAEFAFFLLRLLIHVGNGLERGSMGRRRIGTPEIPTDVIAAAVGAHP